jgi:hypothetical protein
MGEEKQTVEICPNHRLSIRTFFYRNTLGGVQSYIILELDLESNIQSLYITA